MTGLGLGLAFGLGLTLGLKLGVAVAVGLELGLGVGWTPPHGVKGDWNVRGFGSAAAKSLALLFVSVHPPLIRVIDLFDAGTVAGAPSKHVLDPQPIPST